MADDSGLDETRLELFFDDDLQQYTLFCHLTEEKILLPAVGTWRLGFDETRDGAAYLRNGDDPTWVDDWSDFIVYRQTDGEEHQLRVILPDDITRSAIAKRRFDSHKSGDLKVPKSTWPSYISRLEVHGFSFP